MFGNFSASKFFQVKQAQSFYYAAKKKPFTYFACNEAVKDHSSFIEMLPTTPSPYANNYQGTRSVTESSPTINLADEKVNQTPQSNVTVPLSQARPIGIKVAKETR